MYKQHGIYLDRAGWVGAGTFKLSKHQLMHHNLLVRLKEVPGLVRQMKMFPTRLDMFIVHGYRNEDGK